MGTAIYNYMALNHAKKKMLSQVSHWQGMDFLSLALLNSIDLFFLGSIYFLQQG